MGNYKLNTVRKLLKHNTIIEKIYLSPSVSKYDENEECVDDQNTILCFKSIVDVMIDNQKYLFMQINECVHGLSEQRMPAGIISYLLGLLFGSGLLEVMIVCDVLDDEFIDILHYFNEEKRKVEYEFKGSVSRVLSLKIMEDLFT